MSGRILAGFLALLLMTVAGAAEPTRVVQAEEILEKIELGLPAEYENVIVVGDLDLSRLNLTRVPVDRTWFETIRGLPDYEALVTNPISINNSVILGSVNLNAMAFQSHAAFEGTRFEGPAFMLGSKFNQTAEFQGAQFNRTADFLQAQFNQNANFRKAQFNQNASFTETQFNQTADFQKAQFNYDVYFWEAQFNQTANFQEAQFNYDVYFWEAQFNYDVYFWEAQFNQTADFLQAQFHYASFWKVQFNQTADFLQAQFNQNANFRKAQFNQTASFQKARFNHTADFSEVQFNQESYFSDTGFLNVILNESQFTKEAFFQGAQIKGTLSLYRTKYDTLNIRWSSIHDLAYDDTAYHLLIQNFNKLGFTDDASECQYRYRWKHREELFRQHRFYRWLFDLLAYATYGYRLRPERPLGWALSLILLGGLFFFWTGSLIRSRPGPSEKRPLALRRIEKKSDANVSIWEAFLLSATYFTSGASSTLSNTPTEFVPVGRGRYIVVLLRLMGWIFFVLFLSSLTRTV